MRKVALTLIILFALSFAVFVHSEPYAVNISDNANTTLGVLGNFGVYAASENNIYFDINWGDKSAIERYPSSGTVVPTSYSINHSFPKNGSYRISIRATDLTGSSNWFVLDYSTVKFTANDISSWYSFTKVLSIDSQFSDSSQVKYLFDWNNDGVTDTTFPSTGWIVGPDSNNFQVQHTFQSTGETRDIYYSIKAITSDGGDSGWITTSAPFTIYYPDSITSPTITITGSGNTRTISVVSADAIGTGASFNYGIDYGNDFVIDEHIPANPTNYVLPGVTQSTTHTFPSGANTVNVIAVDSSGSTSPWSTSTVTISGSSFGVSCQSIPSVQHTGKDVDWNATPQNESGAVTYNWAFSDGTNSALKSVIKNYASPGTISATISAVNGANNASNNCSVLIKRLGVTCSPSPLSAQVNTNVTWTADANNTIGANIDYNWSFDGTLDAVKARTKTMPYATVGLHSAKVTAKDLTTGATFTSDCNAQVNVTSALSPPTISAQPASLTKNVGETATFSVTATGNPSPNYQWQKQSGGVWVDISGATNSAYTTPPLALSDNSSNFRVKVSNTQGDIFSSVANLVVTNAPIDTCSPSGGTCLASCGGTTPRADLSHTCSPGVCCVADLPPALVNQNRIVSLDAAYDGNKKVTVSYLCAASDKNSYLILSDVNGTVLQRVSLYPANDCNASVQQYVFTLIPIPAKKMLGARLDINAPCALCSRSAFVYINPYAKPETVPDASFIVVLGVLAVAVIVLRKKK